MARLNHWVLEASVPEVWVINARHMRNVPGRKTDVADAIWGASLLEHGLVRPSFIPPEPFRALRDLTRYRKSVIEERARESQRLHKVLEDAGVKLSSVASSVLTKSGREMIDALIAGQRDPEVLAEMAKGRMRSKIPQLQDAMAGRFNQHHALLCRAMLARIDQADATVAMLTNRIDELLDPYEAAVSLLVTIPGVARRTAQVILAEIGADMSRFPTAGHLSSWAGMCPGNNESAGKHRSGRTRHGSKWLRKAWSKPARPRVGPRTPTWPPSTPRSARVAGHNGPRSRSTRGPFPRSPLTVRRVRRPALPRQHRHEYAADLPRGLLAGPVDRLRSRPSKPRPDVRCDPARIHQVGAGFGLAGVRPLVPALGPGHDRNPTLAAHEVLVP
ncbi:MAG: IS110 family transposase [Haloechinothrix sp.]